MKFDLTSHITDRDSLASKIEIDLIQALDWVEKKTIADKYGVRKSDLFTWSTFSGICDSFAINGEAALIHKGLFQVFSVPKEYRELDLSLLAHTSPLKIKKSLEWEYQKKGMILYGDPRKGKTRICFQIALKEMIRSRGKLTFRWFDSFAFGSTSSKSFLNGIEQDWITQLVNPEILFLDDIGKTKFTERVCECLFTCVDRRLSFGKPTLLTSNFIADDLLEHFKKHGAKENGIALIARLRECCESINF